MGDQGRPAVGEVKVEKEEVNRLDKQDRIIADIAGKNGRISRQLRVCEYCGVEDAQMSGCRQCGKVWYCSPPCRRADVKQHTSVCRAFITVRRFREERSAFAGQLREPEDGCCVCGFYRDSQVDCGKCGEVSFCCDRCSEAGQDRHKTVCDAFVLIETYRREKLMARELEVD